MKKILGVDIDNTIADFDDGFKNYIINEKTIKKPYSIIESSMITLNAAGSKQKKSF